MRWIKNLTSGDITAVTMTDTQLNSHEGFGTDNWKEMPAKTSVYGEYDANDHWVDKSETGKVVIFNTKTGKVIETKTDTYSTKIDVIIDNIKSGYVPAKEYKAIVDDVETVLNKGLAKASEGSVLYLDNIAKGVVSYGEVILVGSQHREIISSDKTITLKPSGNDDEMTEVLTRGHLTINLYSGVTAKVEKDGETFEISNGYKIHKGQKFTICEENDELIISNFEYLNPPITLVMASDNIVDVNNITTTTSHTVQGMTFTGHSDSIELQYDDGISSLSMKNGKVLKRDKSGKGTVLFAFYSDTDQVHMNPSDDGNVFAEVYDGDIRYDIAGVGFTNIKSSIHRIKTTIRHNISYKYCYVVQATVTEDDSSNINFTIKANLLEGSETHTHPISVFTFDGQQPHIDFVEMFNQLNVIHIKKPHYNRKHGITISMQSGCVYSNTGKADFLIPPNITETISVYNGVEGAKIVGLGGANSLAIQDGDSEYSRDKIIMRENATYVIQNDERFVDQADAYVTINLSDESRKGQI